MSLLDSRLCRHEIFRKLLTWADLQKNGGFSGTCARPRRKSFTANQWHRWNAYTLEAFWGSQTTRYQESQMGEPQTHKKIRVPEMYFIHLIDVEKSTEFNGTIIFFQIRAKSQRYRQKTAFAARHLELTLVVSYYYFRR